MNWLKGDIISGYDLHAALDGAVDDAIAGEMNTPLNGFYDVMIDSLEFSLQLAIKAAQELVTGASK